jgi:peptide subunit release factor 1 (eRF1)
MATITDRYLSACDMDSFLAQVDRDEMVEVQIECAECGYKGEAEAAETHEGLFGDCPECFVCFHVES